MPPESAYFLQVNRGKRSLTLDFKKEAGKEVLRALIKEADVLVSLSCVPQTFCESQTDSRTS